MRQALCLLVVLLAGCNTPPQPVPDHRVEIVYFYAWALHEHATPEPSIVVPPQSVYEEPDQELEVCLETLSASAAGDGVTDAAEAGTETAAGGSTGEGIPQDSSAATSQDSPSEQSTIDDQSKGGADLPATDVHTSEEDDTELGAEKKNDALSPQSAATEGELDPCQPAPFEEVQRPMLFVRVGPNCPGCANFKRDLSRDVIGLAELIGSRAQIVEVPAQPGQPRPAFKLAGGQWLIGYYGPRELKTWFERELERMNP